MRLLCLHLDRFPVQRRVRESPSLKGRPFVLAEEVKGVRRVAFASTAAMRAGIRPGMTVTAASALMAELASFPYQPEAERRAMASLGEALMALGPAFQLCPPEAIWLDASAAHLFGGERGLAERACATCQEHGYRASAAVASQLFTAWAVARFSGKPVACIGEGESAAALADLPLLALEGPTGLSNGQAAPFAALGLTTLGEVAALPEGAVVARLGAAGLEAVRLARGEDDTPFTPEPVAPVLEESVQLDWPAESIEPVSFAAKTVLDRLCGRLAGRQQAAIRVRIVLRLDPAGSAELPIALARPSARAKLLLELLRHRLAEIKLEHPVVGVHAEVVESCPASKQQLELSDAPEGDAPLEVVLSRLATTLGEGTFFSAEICERHRPEAAFRPCAFRPPVSGEEGQREVEELFSSRPVRLFERPSELVAEVGSSGELVSVRLLGKRRKVTAVAGPERLWGEWWGDESYRRDYYRVYLEGLGPAWVFFDARDGRFYLQGMFD